MSGNFIQPRFRSLAALLLAVTAGLNAGSAFAQGAIGAGGNATSGISSGALTNSASGLLAQGAPPIVNPTRTISPAGTTILPTDVLPLPTIQNRMSFGENFQLRVLQKLPARFYFTSSTEVTLRYETNPFQFPTKRRFIRELGPSITNFNSLSDTSKKAIEHQLELPGSSQSIFRVLPNVTGGYTLTPHTRIFANYFMIRDSLERSTRLNTTINSIAYGLQQDVPLGSRANLQGEIQFRELYQPHQHNVFDFLPGLTLSYVVTPRTVAFVNALMQIRGNEYFQAPTRELDPFYTWGFLHQRGGWSFSASTTFVQNFREQFPRAQIKQNNYSFISDFEIARRLFRSVPGLQAFMRAEPIWNFHGRYRPGLAGMDFRLFYGFRMALSKPALTSALDSLRRQLEEQEAPTNTPSTGPKPSAYLLPHELIAATPQPIHGFMTAPVVASASNGDDKPDLLAVHSQMPEPGWILPGRTVGEQIDESDSSNDSASRVSASTASFVPATYYEEVQKPVARPSSRSMSSRKIKLASQPKASHKKHELCAAAVHTAKSDNALSTIADKSATLSQHESRSMKLSAPKLEFASAPIAVPSLFKFNSAPETTLVANDAGSNSAPQSLSSTSKSTDKNSVQAKNHKSKHRNLSAPPSPRNATKSPNGLRMFVQQPLPSASEFKSVVKNAKESGFGAAHTPI